MSRPALIALAGVLALGEPHAAQSRSAPTQNQVERFLRDLDDYLNAGEVESYLGSFDRDRHPVFDTTLRNSVEFVTMSRMRARSTLQRYAHRGPVGIARVQTRYALRGENGEERNITTYVCVELRDGKTVGRFAVEVDPKRAEVQWNNPGVFTCAACNYELRFSDEWLAVPIPALRLGCLETIWLVSLKDRLHIEAVVEIGSDTQPADQIMDRCLESPRAKAMMKPAHDLVPWTPTFLGAGTPPAAVSSIRAVGECLGGRCAEMNLIVVGRLRYMIVVRGRREVIDENRTAVNRVLDGFKLLDPKLSPARMGALATQLHTGRGTLTADNVYTNPTYKVAITGPAGWEGSIQAGAWLFQVFFRCPESGAFLNVRAMPRIVPRWNRALVDRSMAQDLKDSGREEDGKSGWESRGGFWCRQLRTRLPGQQTDHLRTYAFRSDMLIIVDGSFVAPAPKDRILHAIASLRRLR